MYNDQIVSCMFVYPFMHTVLGIHHVATKVISLVINTHKSCERTS